MKTLTVAIGVLLALGTGAVYAQDNARAGGWYLGAGAGWSDPTDNDLDDATGYKLFGGFRFNERVSGEVGYTNLGEFDDGGNIDIDGYQASVVGNFPFQTNLAVLARAGLYMWDANSSIAGIGDDDGVDGVLGLGAEYNLGNQFSLRAEWEWYTDVGETEVNLYSAGLIWNF